MARKRENCEVREKYKYWNELPPTKHSFFKIMPDDFDSQLFIPKKFTDCFKGKLSSCCTLQGPGGNKWRVRLLRSKENTDHFIFTNGWSSFVGDHNIQIRDFLVFNYIGDSSFNVVIFDGSGCEREECHFVKNGKRSENRSNCSLREEDMIDISDSETKIDESESSVGGVNRMNRTKYKNSFGRDYSAEDSMSDDYMDESTDLESDEESSKSCSKQSRRLNGSSSHIPTPARPLSQLYHKSNRRMLEEGEKYIAIKRAEKHQSRTQYPMVLITMKPTYVYTGFNLTIPKKWAATHILHKTQLIEMRVPKVKNIWLVGCRWTRSGQCQLRKNWPQFVADNTLEEHDVCAFELINKGEANSRVKINVHIYRVVEEVTPLTVSRRMVQLKV